MCLWPVILFCPRPAAGSSQCIIVFKVRNELWLASMESKTDSVVRVCEVCADGWGDGTVIWVKGVKEWNEDTALRGSGVRDDSWWWYCVCYNSLVWCWGSLNPVDEEWMLVEVVKFFHLLTVAELKSLKSDCDCGQVTWLFQMMEESCHDILCSSFGHVDKQVGVQM